MYSRMLNFLMLLPFFFPSLAFGQIWNNVFCDAGNSSSTSVPVAADMQMCWSRPAGTVHIEYAPLVSVTSSGEQLMISGDKIYDAWTGVLKYSLPQPANRTVIAPTTIDRDGTPVATNVLLTGWPSWDVLYSYDGYVYTAYDLDTLTTDGTPLWQLDPTDPDVECPISIVENVEFNAHNGVFYIGGYTLDGVTAIAAIRAADGYVLWQTELPGRGEYSGCAIGTFDVGTVDEREMLFATFTATTDAQAGILALSASEESETGVAEIWWDNTISHRIYTQRPTLDAVRGLVYTTDETDATNRALLAYAANSFGEATPQYTAVIDGILNGPPTFGQSLDEDGVACDAVFVVTNPFNDGASIYAFKRDDLTPLWKTEYPEACWTGSTYSNGRLYVLGNTGDFISVFDADSGAPIYEEFIATDWQAEFLSIADVRDQGGDLHSMVYHYRGNEVFAFTDINSSPPTPEFTLKLAAASPTISVGETTIVTATLASSEVENLAGYAVTFSCNAANNQGHLTQTTVATDSSGIATTDFVSEKRDGVVQVTARVAALDLAQTAEITISKSDEPEPPPSEETGSISGVVTMSNGKPARKVQVDLNGTTSAGTAINLTTTTNPQGKYTFESVPAGGYLVSVSVDGESGSTEVTVVAGQTATANIQL